MQKKMLLSFFALLMSLAITNPVEAEFKPWAGSSIVRDPEWQKRFMGSYGFLSGVEPELRPSELEILREVIDLMQLNPKAAATMLVQRTAEDRGAAVDFILANLQFQNGELESAAERYEAALKKFPDFRRAHKNLGLLRVQMNQLDKAADRLARAVELGDRDGRTYGLLGYSYVNLENYLAAEVAYRNAVLAQPDIKDWQLGLARSLLAMEKYQEAAALFSAMIEKDAGDATLWTLQANAFLGLDQPRKAVVNLEAVRILGKADPRTLMLLGDIHLNEGNADLAREAYLAVVEQDDEALHLAAAQRAASLLLRIEAYAEVEKLIQAIDQRYGESLRSDDELEMMTLKAKLARAQGRSAVAARLLETIVDRDGTRGGALIELAQYHHDAGNVEKARLMFERAENLEAFEYEALVQHAQHEVSERDYASATNLLRRAIRIKSEPRIERFLARVEDAAGRR